MSTLDMPQHEYVCDICGCCGYKVVAPGCCGGGMEARPTLTFADFAEYYAEAGLVEGFCGYGPLPDPLAVWDRLEAVADTLPSNRAAIDAAINYCRRVAS